MSALQLRFYQREAINAVARYWKSRGGNPLIEICTGGGKSLVIAKLCQELLERWPKFRILILVHTRELVGQNCQELLKLWPQGPIGINSAGLNRRDWRSQILFASIQSIYKSADLLGRVDLVIIDEAQMLPRKSESMYGKLLDELRATRPGMRLMGLTATPYRVDSGRLDQGDGRLFDKTVYSYGIADGIRDGYLSYLITKAMVAEIDTKGVNSNGGEFVAAQLERAAISGDKVERAVEEMCMYGRERAAWLAFCCGVKHSMLVRDALRARGIAAESVTNECTTKERDEYIAAFRARKIKCLTNVNVLSVGSNFPFVDMLALLRPTKSPGLAVQQIGRGTRPVYAEGYDLGTTEGRLDALSNGPKPNCLVLDFGQVFATHGPVDNINPPPEKKKKALEDEETQIKVCPECNGISPKAAFRCEQCGYAWPRTVSEPRGDDPTHDAHADPNAVALTSQERPKWVTPRKWAFKRHTKPGKPPTLRITYYCGMSSFSEWLAFDSGPAAKKIAARRWLDLRNLDNGRSFFVPQSVDEALEHAKECLLIPDEILVRRKDNKYFEIVQTRRQSNAVAA